MELGNSNSLSADYSLTYSYAPSSSASCSTPQGTGDNGNITGATYTDNVNSGFSNTATYCYDGVNRLTQAIATGNTAYNFTYQYDQYGNGTCVSGSGGGTCTVLDFNSGKNQVTDIGGAGGEAVNYDAAGNQLNDQFFNYQYDAEGRVKSSTDISGPYWQYPVYNALGQRVEDYQDDGAGYSMTLTYPRDIWGHRTGTYDQRPRLNWSGWDVYWARVAGQRLNMGGSSAYLAHADAIGTTHMVTDPAGAVVWDAVFGPWGQTLQSGGSRPYAVFASLEWPVNEIVYPSATRGYNYRVYRWNTPDPGGVKVVKLDDPQTWNMYAYVTDNPTTENDPSGEACFFGITIFGSYFGGRCSSDTPPPPPSPPGPPEGAVGTATFDLIAAQNEARANPAFQPRGKQGTLGRKTFCNLATCSIASKTGAPTGPLQNDGVPLLANKQIQNLLHSGQYHQVSPGEAQALANQGVTVFAGQPHMPSGHIATVRPTNTYFAPFENYQDPQGTGPMINNIGGHVDIVPQSGAFYSMPPVIYIAPNNPNE